MSALLELTIAVLMQHVPIRLDPLIVHVILVLVEME